MPDDKDDEVNREIEGHQKKKELKRSDLDEPFDQLDEAGQRLLLKGLGKMSEEQGGDAKKMDEKIEKTKAELAKRLGIDLNKKGPRHGRDS